MWSFSYNFVTFNFKNMLSCRHGSERRIYDCYNIHDGALFDNSERLEAVACKRLWISSSNKSFLTFSMQKVGPVF